MSAAHTPEDLSPEDLSPDYVNTGVQEAISALQAAPDHEHLAKLLLALRQGNLVADVTGAVNVAKTKNGARGTRVRTIRSTTGQLVLPLFTSMDELRGAYPAAQREQAKGAIMPAQQALALIASDRFVAAEFDKGSAGLVILRKFVTLAISDRPITADLLRGGA